MGDGDVGWTLRLLALVPLCYILVQGSFYWHLKIRAVVYGTQLPSYFSTVFRFFQVSNIPALGIPFVVLLTAILLDRASVADVAWSASLLAFAILEHINYYVYQLMHDTANDLAYLKRHRKFRRAPLAEDLRLSQRH